MILGPVYHGTPGYRPSTGPSVRSRSCKKGDGRSRLSQCLLIVGRGWRQCHLLLLARLQRREVFAHDRLHLIPFGAGDILPRAAVTRILNPKMMEISMLPALYLHIRTLVRVRTGHNEKC